MDSPWDSCLVASASCGTLIKHSVRTMNLTAVIVAARDLAEYSLHCPNTCLAVLQRSHFSLPSARYACPSHFSSVRVAQSSGFLGHSQRRRAPASPGSSAFAARLPYHALKSRRCVEHEATVGIGEAEAIVPVRVRSIARSSSMLSLEKPHLHQYRCFTGSLSAY